MKGATLLCLLSVSVLPTVMGCCLIPVPSIDDPEGTAPGLEGTWRMESEGNEMLTLEVDATGDPATAILPASAVQDQLPFEIPSDLILNGRQHVVDVPLVPIWLIYIGTAEAVKGGEPGSIAVGESIDVDVFVKLYVRLPLLLTPAQKLSEITLNYSGSFTSATKAEGQSDVKVELTGIADFIAGLTDMPAEELDTSIGDTDLVKQ